MKTKYAQFTVYCCGYKSQRGSSDISAVYLAANGVEGKQDLGKARGEICKEYSSGL